MSMSGHPPLPNLELPTLRQAYSQGLTPRQLTEYLLAQARQDTHHAWIRVLENSEAEPWLQALEQQPDAFNLPLYGVPFAIKDNIDLAGIRTTAGCPAYGYTPTKSAFVVQTLLEAGAIPLGKTNLDQFATGLNGTRSPYGVATNAWHPEYTAGGSSSGSALAVALQQASFALGTDTAGSGRVPAAYQGIFGLKPGLGALSSQGVVPACRTIDSVSLFTGTAADAATLFQLMARYDAAEPFSRPYAILPSQPLQRIGVLPRNQLEFFGNSGYQQAYDRYLAWLHTLPVELAEIDFTPFMQAARMLYEGAWVAERYLTVKDILHQQPEALLDVIRQIIEPAAGLTATAAFEGMYQLAEFKQLTDQALAQVDAILMPTVGTHYAVSAMLQNPVTLNNHLGHYTNFMNLLNYAAVAMPAGAAACADGTPLPFGVTLFSWPGQEQNLLAAAGQYSLSSFADNSLKDNWP